ncbi:hypothetical protein KPL71_000714 [Citrus sinensis]|uniref:Uncharacterized protein n=1 Tax=Citrus sinensis TaxID=2711 RepID=A0ACB8NRV3_CITSI|nr:hypothetical protein KPL71_000714 [Citrus sinensis]
MTEARQGGGDTVEAVVIAEVQNGWKYILGILRETRYIPRNSLDLTYRSRFPLHDSADSIGLSGLLVLPGSPKPSETFCSYISINNSSTLEVRDVVLRAEIQTDRQRILLSFKACFENHTKLNLYMDQVEFEPAQNWSATMFKADGPHSDYNAQSRETSMVPVLIRSGRGIHNYLYQLKMLSHGSSSQVKVQESNVLGKLQITWRTNLGEPGRL